MVKTIEKHGLPVVHLINLIPVAQSVGANRMVETVSIPYPFGDPSLSPEAEAEMRYERVGLALKALQTPITEAKVF